VLPNGPEDERSGDTHRGSEQQELDSAYAQGIGLVAPCKERERKTEHRCGNGESDERVADSLQHISPLPTLLRRHSRTLAQTTAATSTPPSSRRRVGARGDIPLRQDLIRDHHRQRFGSLAIEVKP
jgi:hypothetical protein